MDIRVGGELRVMKRVKAFMLSTIAISLGLIGSLGGVTPNCLSYFYEPEKPDLLK